MQDFVPGQRWISSAELQMGLGTVLSTEHRTVTIVFMATGETRTYAKQTAPLTRVAFAPGDTILSHDGWGMIVEAVEEQDQLLTYLGVNEQGDRVRLTEGQLNNFMQLNRPTERLFNGQIDRSHWFSLRTQTQERLHQQAQSDLLGLTGCRTSLLPHQLYIAHEVAHRYAPRVLLADEVGLGKTIEAGLILHQQLRTERARRVLILVPETLVHQWLVEMLRRFNLRFSILDAARCAAIESSEDTQNPFLTTQLVLCDLAFLSQQPERLRQALAGDWDMLVVDEAHHLEWAPEESSREYRLVEQLAATTPGVLLLTATPEQLGKASHFARLRLLDPDRFADYEAFLQEEAGYEPIAEAMACLLETRALPAAASATLRSTLNEGDNASLLDTLQNEQADEAARHQAREALLEHLLDRHGTGRILFRNTRAAVKGFPQRELHAYALPAVDAYRIQNDPYAQCTPERTYEETRSADHPAWTEIDPRLPWLHQHLAGLKGNKVLIICAKAQTTLELAEAMRITTGLHAAVFHEGMSIVERDRAAAYFADPEYGTQVLICSEIGSEGRNFQFAHHLVLFDIPMNPDLLEQRIGRLDRIGQTSTIHIHVPYLEKSGQEVLFRWYHEGLNAFEQLCTTGTTVLQKVESALCEAMSQDFPKLDPLLQETRNQHLLLQESLQRGRDRLLEFNSCRPEIARLLTERAQQEDADSGLAEYMDAIFDVFGVQVSLHSEHCFILRPGEHMLSSFPHLPEDGMTITYERDIALANEDMHYLTWDHPMVSSVMERIQSSELGNTAFSTLKSPSIPPGTLLVECLYLYETASSERLQTYRYLPPTPLRLIMDEKGKFVEELLLQQDLSAITSSVPLEVANKIVRAKQTILRKMIEACEQRARQQMPAVIAAARSRSETLLTGEIQRLHALHRINPNVREDEIAYFEGQRDAMKEALEATRLRLDGIRVLVAT